MISFIILKYSEKAQEIAEIYKCCLVTVGLSHNLIYLHKQDHGFPGTNSNNTVSFVFLHN